MNNLNKLLSLTLLLMLNQEGSFAMHKREREELHAKSTVHGLHSSSGLCYLDSVSQCLADIPLTVPNPDQNYQALLKQLRSAGDSAVDGRVFALELTCRICQAARDLAIDFTDRAGINAFLAYVNRTTGKSPDIQHEITKAQTANLQKLKALHHSRELDGIKAKFYIRQIDIAEFLPPMLRSVQLERTIETLAVLDQEELKDALKNNQAPVLALRPEVEMPFHAITDQYTLSGIILRSGGSRAGHFYALSQTRVGEWYLYNGSQDPKRVRPETINDISQQKPFIFDEKTECNPIMLFYQRNTAAQATRSKPSSATTEKTEEPFTRNQERLINAILTNGSAEAANLVKSMSPNEVTLVVKKAKEMIIDNKTLQEISR